MIAPLWRWSAVELVKQMTSGALSAREVLDAHLARIAEVNPRINAIVTLSVERASADAARADAAYARGELLGPLHGLPIAHKDLALTEGIRTTGGSPIFADFVPAFDEELIARLRAAGCVTVGKTNTPEFGAGSQTFNTLFGVTRNPYADARSVGGSSGGAAAALAAGMVPLADGSDLGGSLRNPASFCNVVGLRPTPGTVPKWPSSDPLDPLSTNGPMGRCAADVALMLSVIAGPHPRVPVRGAEGPFAPLERSLRGLRVAWGPDGGGVAIAAEVRAALANVPARFALHGCDVHDAFPDLAGASEIFQTLRAVSFERNLGMYYDEHRDKLKDTVQWNIELARFAERRRCRPRDPRSRGAAGPRPCVLCAVRRARAADLSGRAVSRRCRVGARDRRRSDAQLPRLDAQLHRYHDHRLPGDLGAVRVHPRGASRRPAARRAARRRPAAAADLARL